MTLSRESISDAPVDQLDQVGPALTRAVAAGLDAKAFSVAVVTATAPAGLRSMALPFAIGAVSIDNILAAIGVVAAEGKAPDSVYLAPQGLTTIRQAVVSGGYGVSDPRQPGVERIGGARL